MAEILQSIRKELVTRLAHALQVNLRFRNTPRERKDMIVRHLACNFSRKRFYWVR